MNKHRKEQKIRKLAIPLKPLFMELEIDQTLMT